LAFATQIAGALHGARRFAELERRAALLELVAEVAREALQDIPQELLLERVLAHLARRYTALEATVMLESGLLGHLEVAAHISASPDQTYRGKLWSTERGIVGRCFRSGQPQLVDDVRSDPDYTLINSAVRTELAVPIRGRGRVFGVLNLEASDPRAFDQLNRMLLHTLADQLGTAIELALTQRRLAQSEAVRDRQEERLRLGLDGARRITARQAPRPGIDSDTGLPGSEMFATRVAARLRRAHREKIVVALAVLAPAGAENRRLGDLAARVRTAPELRRGLIGRWDSGHIAVLAEGSAAERLYADPGPLARAARARLAIGVVGADRDIDIAPALALLAEALQGSEPIIHVDLKAVTRQRPRRGRPNKQPQ
jgi:GAF domain-containing protein